MPKGTHTTLLLAVLCVLSLPTAAHGKIFRVVDKRGNVHFTNRNPDEGKNARRSEKTREVSVAQGSWWVVGNGRRGSRRAIADRSHATRPTRFDRLIVDAATRARLPAAFVRAVIRAESNFNPRAVSHAGAQGLMQLIPNTARRMGIRDPFDPRDNIAGGTRYLRFLADAFAGQLPLVIAGYHAGEEAVHRFGGIPPWTTTRAYLQSVLSHYAAFQSIDVKGTR